MGQLGSLNYHLSGEFDWKRKNFLFGVVGLKLSIPIFDAFETKARIRTAKINLEDAKLAHDDALLRIQKDISQAWQGAVTASENALRMKFEYLIRKKIIDIETQFVTKVVK